MREIYLFLFLTVVTSLQFIAKAQSINITGPAGNGQFGYSVTVLTNGNYLVTDSFFENSAIMDVGAVYLYNGSTYVLIDKLKSSMANDQIGIGGITALSNENYVVSFSIWDNGIATDAGAISQGNGIKELS